MAKNITNNLGFQTDFIFLEEAREIVDFSTYTLVKSPNQPTFYYGNYLLLNSAPTGSDKGNLEKTFAKHFNDDRVKHFTFCWSGTEKNKLDAFLDAKYKLEEISVLTINKKDLITLKNKNEEILIRELNSDLDWDKWINLECTENTDGGSPDAYKKYITGRADVYKKLNTKGFGNFYGAFINDVLIASAGLFYQKNVGRFQSVITLEKHRRKGISKSLLHHICSKYLNKLDSLVITADKNYFAIDLYKNIGFKETAFQTSIYWSENFK